MVLHHYHDFTTPLSRRKIFLDPQLRVAEAQPLSIFSLVLQSRHTRGPAISYAVQEYPNILRLKGNVNRRFCLAAHEKPRVIGAPSRKLFLSNHVVDGRCRCLAVQHSMDSSHIRLGSRVGPNIPSILPGALAQKLEWRLSVAVPVGSA